MGAKREFRDRDDDEVAVLDALVDRAAEGMTVLELRAAVDADIDAIEDALAALKRDDLITVEEQDDRVVILPEDRVVPEFEPEEEADRSVLDEVRDRFGL